jgi:SAM-dependent methyltransferase
MSWSEQTIVGLGAALGACLRTPSTPDDPDSCSHQGVDARLGDYLVQHRSEIATWLDAVLAADPAGEGWSSAPARSVRKLAVRWLHSKNQFLQLEGEHVSRLERGARSLLISLRELLQSAPDSAAVRHGATATLAVYREQLERVFCSLQPQGAASQVICSEYSPELQFEVLGLSLNSLRAPLLDVGCGVQAQLVAWLRARSIEAFGLDRDANGDHLVEADWLEYAFEPSQWGMIVSHLGFSLHFLHHHLGSAEQAARYAKKYLEILRALRPQGIFAYAPAVPFFEQVLPRSHFRVQRVALPLPLLERVGKLKSLWGDETPAACHVERLR